MPTARPTATLLRQCSWPYSAPQLHCTCTRQYQRRSSAPCTSRSGGSSRACSSRAVGSSNAAACTEEAGRLLNAFVGPRLQLHEQAYNVQDRVLRLISPSDVDAVLDVYIAQGLDRDPYWCRAWPSAICLAQQLLQRPDLVKGKKVADFGSGLGVAGLAAALAGAAEVVLLDREPMALYCGLLSAAASGVSGVTGLQELQQLVDQETCQTQQQQQQQQQHPQAGQHAGSAVQQPAHAVLLQALLKQQRQRMQEQAGSSAGRENSPAVQDLSSQHDVHVLGEFIQQPAAARCTYRAVPFDWSSSGVTERYDVVLACDVLYESEAVELVASVIPELLKPGSSSTLLLADPPTRTVANRERFLELISAAQPTRLLLQESGVEQCDVQQLDPEMLGGVTSESVAVQFMVFQSAVGKDTISLKAL